MWGLSTAQKEKGRETETRGAEKQRETQPCHAEEIWETHSPQPLRRLHLEDPGAEPPLPAPVRRPLGLQRPRLGSAKEAGDPSFPESKLLLRCLVGQSAAPEENWTASDSRLRPPRCWGQEAPGEGQPDILGGRDPGPARWPRPRGRALGWAGRWGSGAGPAPGMGELGAGAGHPAKASQRRGQAEERLHPCSTEALEYPALG